MLPGICTRALSVMATACWYGIVKFSGTPPYRMLPTWCCMHPAINAVCMYAVCCPTSVIHSATSASGMQLNIASVAHCGRTALAEWRKSLRHCRPIDGHGSVSHNPTQITTAVGCRYQQYLRRKRCAFRLLVKDCIVKDCSLLRRQCCSVGRSSWVM